MRTVRAIGIEDSRHRTWPLFALLLAAVLIPTVCVLWFMSQAVDNVRLAARQRVTAACKQTAVGLQERLARHWRGKLDALAAVDGSLVAGEAFQSLVVSGICDSVVVHGPTGAVIYPSASLPGSEPARSPRMAQARRLEHESARPAAAMVMYAGLAAETGDSRTRAMALLGQARCLVKVGRSEQAVEVLTGPLADPQLAAATDERGRLLVPNAQLLALEVMRQADGSGRTYTGRIEDTRAALRDRVNDYGAPAMPAAQRLFLMEQLAATGPPFATYEAEVLVAELVAAGDVRPIGSMLQPTRTDRVWMLPAPGGRLAGLFRQERIVAEIRRVVDAAQVEGVSIETLAPGTEAKGAPPLLTAPAGEILPGWQIALRLNDVDPVGAEARRLVSAYVWTATGVIALIIALVALVGRLIGRQLRLTRLKNDLIATVSHELKTPLASMRVLVDTLLAGRVPDKEGAEEYLRLIAKENQRLSRMIDNFLTFSRMERNKRAFVAEDVRIGEVVAAAVDALADRLGGDRCRLRIDVPDDLPTVTGDPDALVTACINLLENAWKYTGEDKRISVHARAVDGDVRVEVSDNGVGLSRRAVRRVFHRFYQVDRSLSRSTGGVGLGLSIVKFIIAAHDGTIQVSSRPGQGSTFTVRLPLYRSASQAPGRRRTG